MSNTNMDNSMKKELSPCDNGIRKVLSMMGDKWSMFILVRLKNGPLRFGELGRQVDNISQRMLTRTLRDLERNGLLTRTVKNTLPPSVYYDLTPLGKKLLPHIDSLNTWAQKYYPTIQKAQAAYDDNQKNHAE